MSMEKKNKNFLQYEQKIVDAFIRLFNKNGGKHISVADIVKQAEITRPTFYLHFKSTDDIYKCLENKLAQRYIAFFKVDLPTFVDKLLDFHLEFAKKIKANQDFFTCLAKSNHFGEFIHNVAINVCSSLSNMDCNCSAKNCNFIDCYECLDHYTVVQIVMNAYVAKLRGDVKVSYEFLAHWCADYTYRINYESWKKQGLIKKNRDYMKEYRTKNSQK